MKSHLLLLVFPALITISSFAANPVVVYTFECKNGTFQGEGPCPQGGRAGALIVGSDGNFYGTAQDSAEGSSTPSGGTVYSVTPAGKFTLLHTFLPGAGNDYPDGNVPGLLVEGSDGKIYGTTLFGGVGGCNGYCGNGVLCRIDRNGSEFQVIHEFCSETNCADGGFWGNGRRARRQHLWFVGDRRDRQLRTLLPGLRNDFSRDASQRRI